MSEQVVASVIVPVRNEEAHLRATIAAIRSQRVDELVEFLFVEGCSDDGTRALLDELTAGDPRMRVLDNPRRIVPCALNVGLRHARGDFVGQYNGHSRYPPQYLALAIARMRRGDVEQVSGPQIPEGSGPWSRRVALALGSWFGIGGAGWRRVPPHEVEVESGWGGLWRRATLESLGGWDEGFPVNEDAEIAARIRALGGRMVSLPELAARYTPRDSLGGLARQYWRYGHYRVKTTRRHPGCLRRSHLLAPGVVLAVAAAPLHRAARLGAAIYAVALAGASARCAHDCPREAPGVAAVFVTMHFAWGAGFLAGCARFGPPLAAFADVARR